MSVLVSVLGSLLLALALDGKWQFRYYKEYKIARLIARSDRFTSGSRVDEKTTKHKEIYLRTVHNVAHKDKELGMWDGPVYKALTGNGDVESSRDSVPWSYVIKDSEYGHR